MIKGYSYVNVVFQTGPNDDNLVVSVPVGNAENLTPAHVESVVAVAVPSAVAHYGDGSIVTLSIQWPDGDEAAAPRTGTLSASGRLVRDDLYPVINECLYQLRCTHIRHDANPKYIEDHNALINLLVKYRIYL